MMNDTGLDVVRPQLLETRNLSSNFGQENPLADTMPVLRPFPTEFLRSNKEALNFLDETITPISLWPTATIRFLLSRWKE